MKRFILILCGLMASGALGAQNKDLDTFLSEYLRVTEKFTTALEKVTTSSSATKAVEDYILEMKPLAKKAKELEAKYKNWGSGMLLADPLLEKQWQNKFEKTMTRLITSMGSLYQLAAKDTKLLAAIEKMGTELEEVWPQEDGEDAAEVDN